MNERIRELYRQSMTDGYLGKAFDPEKFAELIIQDAIAAVQSWKGEPFPFSEDLAADLIREHFGMK